MGQVPQNVWQKGWFLFLIKIGLYVNKHGTPCLERHKVACLYTPPHNSLPIHTTEKQFIEFQVPQNLKILGQFYNITHSITGIHVWQKVQNNNATMTKSLHRKFQALQVIRMWPFQSWSINEWPVKQAFVEYQRQDNAWIILLWGCHHGYAGSRGHDLLFPQFCVC